MSEFVGRTGSKRVYSYPETPRGGGSLAFARNFAIGPLSEGPLFVTTGGLNVPWSSIESVTDWSSTTTYEPNSVVTFGGATYISIAFNNLNHQPDVSPTFWALDNTSVPITPEVTGIVRVDGTISLANGTGAPADVRQVQIVIDGGFTLPSPAAESVTVPANGFAAIPITAIIDAVSGAGPLPTGATTAIQIKLTASADNVVVLRTNSSSVSLQEVSVASG